MPVNLVTDAGGSKNEGTLEMLYSGKKEIEMQVPDSKVNSSLEAKERRSLINYSTDKKKTGHLTFRE